MISSMLREPAHLLAFVLLVCAVLFTLRSAVAVDSWLSSALLLSIAAAITVMIFISPHVGIAVTIATIPIVEALPETQLFTSSTMLLGTATFFSFLSHRYLFKTTGSNSMGNPGLVLLLLLVAWIILSNLSASVAGGDRVWAFTFLQLLTIAWLAGMLMDSLKRQRLVMMLFVAASLISAIVTIQQGSFGEALYETTRGYGLSIGSNTTARYLLIGLAFLFAMYIAGELRSMKAKVASLVAAGILLLGCVFTMSRSGYVLGLVLVGLFSVCPTVEGKKRAFSLVVLGAVYLFLIVPGEAWKAIVPTILPSITEGENTMGLRYKLWQAGIQMFSDHIVSGVGIGRYPSFLPQYGAASIPSHFLSLTPHSMYIQILAETGIVGMMLFCISVIYALRKIWAGMRLLGRAESSYAWAWFSVLVVFLVGGLTKTDFADKLFWASLGMAFSIPNRKPVAPDEKTWR